MSEGPISTSAMRRSFILGGVMFAVFVALMLRILWIQTVNFEQYQSKVIEQMTTESPVPANRGKIYDRNGNVLATNITTYRVFISPSGIKNAQASLGEGATVDYATLISKGLSELLADVRYEDVYKQATEYTAYLDRTIRRKVDEETADLVRAFIEEHSLNDMVYLEAQSTRYYPGNALGAHVLGFTSSDGVGLYGLELQYNEYLKGVDGYYIKARDSYGNEMPFEYASYIEAVHGYNLKTTIDTTVQHYLEEQLEQAVLNSNAANRACGIVMDVDTGAILAMATSSPFDLNDPWKLDAISEATLANSGYAADSEEYANLQRDLLTSMWSNKAITESYIPGSTFKIITSAMALEEGVVKVTGVKKDTCTCNGYLSEAGHKIHCHKRTGHGPLTFAEGLQQSCNVWFMTLGQRIGVANYTNYVQAFGYKEKTGIDLPGEGSSIFTSEMTQLDLMIYAFGQNFNVTPIQQITAVSAVANGGNLMTPYLVEQITDDAGNIIYRHSTERRRAVVSEQVCATISDMLEEGVSGNGGAKNAYVAGYRVAAKTGTSEKKEKGKEGLYICSTVAYAPADDPQVAIIIMVDEPAGSSPYGSTVAAPYVGATLKNVLKHLGVEAVYTEKEQQNMMTTVGSYRLWSAQKAKETIEARGLACEIIGNGSVVTSQYPASGTEILKENGKIVLCTDNAMPKTVKVPDLVGRGASAATVSQILRAAGLNLTVAGPMNEKVYAQSIAPGTEVPIGTTIEVTFRSMEGDEDPNYRN